ncbi:fibronectin type III domain-containing protein [Streptomyces sp. T028]|uniref:fibronectin type III domain-containing protein n=1 Tax=Streptomyces sp. T028 TaxID=3394379 RepID=UPI003A86972C
MPGENRTPGLRLRGLTEGTAPPAPRRPGVRQRGAALAAAVRARLRPTRNRVTGYIAISAVGALIGTSLAVGVGVSGTIPRLADIGAWLSSSEKGEVAHANGLTGDVDGKVVLPPGMEGHPVSVSQDGETILVLDEKTGNVVRIDASQLTAEQSADYGAAGLQLVSGGAYAYVVDPVKGTVQQIDPAMTTPKGPPVKLGGKPGVAVASQDGTLWVPLPGKGTVVPFVKGRRSTTVKVAEAGHDLVLTLADDRPVVTDRTAAVMKMLTLTGVQDTFDLGDALDDSAPKDILVPTSTDGPTVPVLATGSGVLVLANVGSGQVVHARLPVDGTDLGAPQVLGKRVYVPDESSGRLLVYDVSAAALVDPVQVTEGAGQLELFVRNGLLWVNDQDNAAAAVINAGGKVVRIGKYKEDVPTARKPQDKPVEDSVPTRPPTNQGPPQTTDPAPDPADSAPDPVAPAPGPDPSTDAPNTDPEPEPSGGGTASGTPTPDCEVRWEDGCPEPEAPGTPQAQSGAGVIRITFAAASGVTPKRYVLRGAAAGQTVTPEEVGPEGPFTFEVRGGSCDQQYSFTVVAEYAGGAPSKESAPSVPARPCIAPGAPQQLTITPAGGGHGGTVTWQPPQGADGSVTYVINGTQQVTGTTYTYTGLKNGSKYPVSVTASNAAGSGGAVNGTLDLTPPDKVKGIVHNLNDSTPLAIRTVPSTTEGGRVTRIPGMTQPDVTVHCKTTGSQETHPYTGAVSNVWGKITWNGYTGYVADIYLDSRLDPDIWDCE